MACKETHGVSAGASHPRRHLSADLSPHNCTKKAGSWSVHGPVSTILTLPGEARKSGREEQKLA